MSLSLSTTAFTVLRSSTPKTTRPYHGQRQRRTQEQFAIFRGDDNEEDKKNEDDSASPSIFYNDFGDDYWIDNRNDQDDDKIERTHIQAENKDDPSGDDTTTTSSTEDEEEDPLSSSTTEDEEEDPLSILLQERIGQLLEQEVQKEAQIQLNWQSGNWNVRGITLDLFNSVVEMDEDEEKDENNNNNNPMSSSSKNAELGQSRRRIMGSKTPTRNPLLPQTPEQQQSQSSRAGSDDDNSISSMPYSPSSNQPITIHTCAVQTSSSNDDDDDDDEIILWLGRSDGSLVAIRWSDHEPWARFLTKLLPYETRQQQISVQPGLVKDKSVLKQMKQMSAERNEDEITEKEESDDDVDDDDDDDGEDSFQLVTQLLHFDSAIASSSSQQQVVSPVQHVLPVSYNSNTENPIRVLSSLQLGTGDIYAWRSYSKQAPSFLELATDYKDSPNNDPSRSGIWSGVHSQPLVALEQVQLPWGNNENTKQHFTDLVCSVSRDGTVALWNLSNDNDNGRAKNHMTTGPFFAQFRLQKEQEASTTNNGNDDDSNKNFLSHITSAHVVRDQGWLAVGTPDGTVYLYDWSSVVETDSFANNTGPQRLVPIGMWRASPDHVPVTVLTSITRSTTTRMTSSTNPTFTTYLAAGDGRGMVKQWQLLERRRPGGGDSNNNNNEEDNPISVVIENWPKLETQTLPGGVAHLFPHQPQGSNKLDSNDNDDTSSIVDLRYIQTATSTTKTSTSKKQQPPESSILLVSASSDCVKCWNINTGKESHRLEGFEQLQTICPVDVLAPSSSTASAKTTVALVTNGMKNIACIHDYNSNEFNNDDDEDDFDVGQYLDFEDSDF